MHDNQNQVRGVSCISKLNAPVCMLNVRIKGMTCTVHARLTRNKARALLLSASNKPKYPENAHIT